mgnify:CR=1 FL=1
MCANYRKIKGGYSSHQIRNVVVEELFLEGINRVTAFGRDNDMKMNLWSWLLRKQVQSLA